MTRPASERSGAADGPGACWDHPGGAETHHPGLASHLHPVTVVAGRATRGREGSRDAGRRPSACPRSHVLAARRGRIGAPRLRHDRPSRIPARAGWQARVEHRGHTPRPGSRRDADARGRQAHRRDEAVPPLRRPRHPKGRPTARSRPGSLRALHAAASPRPPIDSGSRAWTSTAPRTSDPTPAAPRPVAWRHLVARCATSSPTSGA